MENNLPKGWVETTLDELCNMVYGKGLLTKHLTADGFTVYGANGVIGKYKVFTYEAPQVIISCRGAASGVIHKTVSKSFVTSNSIVLPLISKEINLDYFKYSLLSVDRSQIVTGSAQPQITIENLNNLTIPIAPLPEQHRIVAKLDALMEKVERNKQRLDKIPTLLKRFRQSVLVAAVSGRLTEDWREENNCINLFLLGEQFAINENYRELIEIPNNWKWVALGNYVKCNRGRFSIRPRNDPKYFGGDIPFIQIGDLPREGGFVKTHTQTLNRYGLKVSKMFPKNTIAIAIVGATIANTGILDYDMCFTDSMVGINTGDLNLNIFIVIIYGLKRKILDNYPMHQVANQT